MNKKLMKLLSYLGVSTAVCLPLSGCHLPSQRDPDNAANPSIASILIASPSDCFESLREPFMWIYEFRVIGALNEKIGITGYEIIKNATEKDLDRVVLDESVSAIVVVGHGNWDDWSYGEGWEKTVSEDVRGWDRITSPWDFMFDPIAEKQK